MKREIFQFAVRFLFLAACCLSAASRAFAVPADPTPRQILLPDGTSVTVMLRGDEYRHWVETENGYSIVRSRRSESWEYAVRDGKGNLVPSGVRVDPAKPPPGTIERRLMPKRSPGLDAPAGKAASGRVLKNLRSKWPQRRLPATRNLLVILAGFADRPLATPASAWGNAVFDNAPGAWSIASYYRDNSYGKFSFVPVNHTQAGSPPGVVAVTLQQDHPNFALTADLINFVNGALAAAAQFVNFSAYDANHDHVFGDDEIEIYFILAGYEGSESAKLPSTFSKHSTIGPASPLAGAFSVSGIKLNKWSQTGELNDSGVRLPIGALVHELGHSLGLPDLYDTSQWSGNSKPNEGIGIFSPMANGSHGSDQAAPVTSGSVPVALDAWSREYLG